MNIQYCLPGSCSLGGSLTDDCLCWTCCKTEVAGSKTFLHP